LQPFPDKLKRVAQAHRELARQFFHPSLRRPVAQGRGRTPLLFYSQVAWDTVWQRPQEEALGLARFRPVVYLSPIQMHEFAGRLAGRWQFARRLLGGRLLVLTPIIFSGEYRSSIVRKANQGILTRIARLSAGKGDVLFMTNTPFTSYLLDAVQPRAVIYDLIDDFCSFGWAPRDGRERERELIARTSLAFAGTGYLRDSFARRLPGLRFLPSGVRFDDLTEPAPEPPDLRDLPRPRLLFVGTLNDKLDGELFRTAATAAGGGSVVVVGPRHGTFEAPELPKNVHFLGLKPHGELRGYYQHCDLGLMPFADNAAARAINPIKTLEYLACGLPVLSTPIPDVERYYSDVVRVEHPGNWDAAIRELLAADDDSAREQRRNFARDRSWNKLVEQVERGIRRLEEEL
jgi:UDP-galactopyranose mutase